MKKMPEVWRLGVAVPAAAHARVGKPPPAKAWPAGAFTCGVCASTAPSLPLLQVALGILRRMGCTNIVTAEDGEAALEALHVRAALLTGIVAHRDCCSQGSDRAAYSCSAAGYTRLGCAATVQACCRAAERQGCAHRPAGSNHSHSAVTSNSTRYLARPRLPALLPPGTAAGGWRTRRV